MKPPHRLLLICKQFWPLSGETELLAAAFARQLTRSAAVVDVLTWRIIRQWPERFQLGGCQVVRLPQSQKPHWTPAALGYYGRNRWDRSLHRWIQANTDRYDGCFVFEFQEDALSPSLIAAKAGLPVVGRIQQKHACSMSRVAFRETRILTQQRLAFVTPDPAPLLDPASHANGPLADVTLIEDGILSSQRRTRDRNGAREVLARVHPIFQIAPQALLAVSGCDLTFDSGVFSLVRAWRRVALDHPDARLWLIGKGRNAQELFQRICDLDLQHSVLLTGNFDDVDDVLSAADAYIMPGSGESAGWYYRVAAQLGIAIIHHRDCPALAVAEQPVTSIPFDDDSRPIDLMIGRWAADRPALSGTRSRPTADPTDSESSMQTMVQKYLQVMQRQVAQK